MDTGGKEDAFATQRPMPPSTRSRAVSNFNLQIYRQKSGLGARLIIGLKTETNWAADGSLDCPNLKRAAKTLDLAQPRLIRTSSNFLQKLANTLRKPRGDPRPRKPE